MNSHSPLWGGHCCCVGVSPAGRGADGDAVGLRQPAGAAGVVDAQPRSVLGFDALDGAGGQGIVFRRVRQRREQEFMSSATVDRI